MNNLSLTELRKFKPLLFVVPAVLIIILLSALFLNGSEKKVAPNTDYEPSIPPYTGKKLEQPKEFETELSRIKKLLPLQGSNYVVEYLSANIIVTKIEANTKEEYLITKSDIEKILKKKGAENICNLNILWVAPRNPTIRRSLQPTDLKTTGCK